MVRNPHLPTSAQDLPTSAQDLRVLHPQSGELRAEVPLRRFDSLERSRLQVHLRPVAQMHSRTHARTVAQTGPQRKALHSSGTKVRCNVTALSTLSTLSAARDRLPAFQHFRARAAAHEPAAHARTETISRRLLQN